MKKRLFSVPDDTVRFFFLKNSNLFDIAPYLFLSSLQPAPEKIPGKKERKRKRNSEEKDYVGIFNETQDRFCLQGNHD